jgi:hypothetical protein
MPAFDGTNAPTIKIQFFYNGAYTDVPRTDLRSVSLSRGRTRPDQRIDAGQMIITLDNRSGDYDPDNSSSPWWLSGQTTLRADLRARLVATWSGTSYVLYVGYLETTKLDAGFDATATMTFVDGISVLGRFTAPAVKITANNGETTSTRVGRMLTYAGWGTGSAWRSLTGSVTLAGTAQNAPIMDIINQCEDAEGGCFYISRTGVATFVTLKNKFSRPTQLTLNDNRAANTVEYYAIDTNPGIYSFVNASLVNYSPNTTSGSGVNQKKGKQVSAQNKASVAKYGLKLLQVDTYILLASVANKLATYYATRTKTPKTLVQSVSFTALALDVLYPDFLETEIQDLCIVKRTTVDGRNQTFELTIEGFKYEITPDNWDVIYYTSPISASDITLP